MGKKHRNRKLSDDAEDNNDTLSQSPPKPTLNPNDKSLDFATRQALKRQIADEKRRAKQKCHFCGLAGHVRRECPGIADDGRGMSRFKNKAGTKTALVKRQAQVEAKRQERKEKSGEVAVVVDYSHHFLELPEGFDAKKIDPSIEKEDAGTDKQSTKEPLLYYDTGADVAATLEYLKSGRGKHKISRKEAMEEYVAVIHYGVQHGLGGVVSTSILKQGRPWVSPLPEDEALENIVDLFHFSVGLHRDFLVNVESDDDDASQAAIQKAINALLETQQANPRIVAFCCDIDYREDYLKRAGCDKESQLRRLKATLEAVGQSNCTLQLQTHPGATSLTPVDPNGPDNSDRVKGTAYAAVLLDTQQAIMDALKEYPNLKIHWGCWNGLASHMTALIQSLPDNLMIGLDASCSFSKAKEAQECAFELPLGKVLLESSTTIPSHVANTLGRDAFYHSATLPFAAEAIAKIKKNVTAAEVAGSAATNSVFFYPELMRHAGNDRSAQDENSAISK